MTQRAELFRALGALAEPPDDGYAAIAEAVGLPPPPGAADYTEVFLFAAYPYASVYLGAEGMLGGEAGDRVAGFWRALGLTPPPEPDHVAALLGLHASIIDAEGQAHRAGDTAGGVGRREARKALLWEHLVAWLPPYLAKVVELAPPFYVAWAERLREAIDAEVEELGRPDRLPLHLRAAPGLPDPGDAPGEWLAALLAPVRSGVVLTRWDLRRAAGALGIGVRAGERAFMLRSLLEQDAAGIAGWLAEAAGSAAAQHAAREPVHGPVARFWRERAEATRVALATAPGVATA